MTRILDSLGSALTGMLLATVMLAVLAPDAFTWSASRSAQEVRPPVSLRADDDRSRSGARPAVGLPGRSEAPTGRSAPAPSVAVSPRPTPTRAPGTVPAVGAPMTGHTVRGVATWFRAAPGTGAAGPALRQALGPDWRGTRVRVCGISTCIAARLTDWCACADRPGGPTLIDLSAADFADLAPLSRGVMEVKVSW